MSAVPPNKPKLTPQEQENLTAYLDHELDDAGAEQVTAALSRRAEVRKEAETLRKTWELLDYLPRPQAPKSFTEQTLTRLSSTKGILLQQGMKWRRYAIAGWAACLLTAGAFGFWLTYSLGREPEVVEVLAPQTDVIPVFDTTHTETVSTAPETKLARKDVKDIKAGQRLLEAQKRNERLASQAGRLYFKVRKKINNEEEERLMKLSKEGGGLPYLAAIIELAHKYKIPLIDPNEANSGTPAKTNKKAVGKGNPTGE
ncbi:MAG TPA: hypothetical protein PLN21_11645 [Gemmatales bacterium]|nr:hypothetical protein [Gemmatales bacterium]